MKKPTSFGVWANTDKTVFWDTFPSIIDWAKKCSTMGSSPVRLLVHKEKGLFISFRGALGINEYIGSPNNSKDICTPCEKPSLTACPVSALNQDGYNVIRCKEYVNTPSGQECRNGCLVRRSCPSGQNFRLKEQSNFQMRAFLRHKVNDLISDSKIALSYQTVGF